MSLFALPVTVDDILLLQDSIQFFTNQAQATSQAAAINAGTSTVYDYAQQLLAANLATSQVAVAVPSLILNETPTVGVIENITLNFLPDQIDFAVSQGLDPVVYAAEAWAVNVASSNAADFNALYGNLNSTQFAAVVSTTTGVNTDAILGFIANWQAFFSANPNAIPPNLNVTTASYAAAFGDAIGNALVDDSVFTEGVNAFAENALLTIATGQYLEGVPPGAIPQHIPLQGEDQGLRLTVNVDTLTTSLPGAVFDATPAPNPPLGQANTLNSGDDLTSTEGDATIEYTTASGLGGLLSNPPFATNVTMNGIATALINNQDILGLVAGFSGDINGLSEVTLVAGSIGDVQVGQAGVGLNDPLEIININASQDFEAWIASAAFAGGEEIGVNLNGVDTFVDLNVTEGSANFYSAVNVSSLTDENSLGLFTNTDTVETVTVDGDQDLDIFGDALFQHSLRLFDASEATGDVTATFGVDFIEGDGDVEAIGGDGDDEFVFLTFPTSAVTTFTAGDSVDGGGGDNQLTIETFTGALLGAGVGPNIVNIQTIEHIALFNFVNGFGTTGNVTVDMSRSGDATNLVLFTDYNGFDVSVTNLTNADNVTYSGFDLNDLTLAHVNPVGINDIIDFTMAGVFGTDFFDVTHTLDALHVAAAVERVDLHSEGDAALNQILSVSDVNTDILTDGPVDLQLGSLGRALVDGTTPVGTVPFFSDSNAYDFAGGTIDSSAATGDVEVFLAGLDFGSFNLNYANPPTQAATSTSQTFIGGEGDDTVHFLGFQNDVADFSVGGSDTAVFQIARYDALSALNSGVYNHIIGFTAQGGPAEIDHINLYNTTWFGDGPNQGQMQFTNSDTVVTAGSAVNILHVTQNNGTIDATTAAFNFIKFDTPVGTAGLNANQGFQAAIGSATIDIDNAGNGAEYLLAYYDTQNQQMVLGTVFGDDVINSTFGLDVIATVGMSLAEYQAFGAQNLAFVATA